MNYIHNIIGSALYLHYKLKKTSTQINIFLESVAIGISNIWPACQNKKKHLFLESLQFIF
jgi:hypothetical protein